jgi:hypothetical protein
MANSRSDLAESLLYSESVPVDHRSSDQQWSYRLPLQK